MPEILKYKCHKRSIAMTPIVLSKPSYATLRYQTNRQFILHNNLCPFHKKAVILEYYISTPYIEHTAQDEEEL